MKTLLTTTAVILSATTAFADINMNKNNQCMEYNGAFSGNVNIHGNNSFLIDVKNTNQTCSSVMGVGGGGTDGADGATGATGATGEQGAQGEQGLSGNDGQDGSRGLTGAAGTSGPQGQTGSSGAQGTNGTSGGKGDKGDAGKDAVAPLGSLSFAAASASFYGDGMGFGLSNSNYGSLEGSIVFGFDLDNDWRVVAGVTTDFKGKTAGSIGVGVSF